MNHLSDKWSGTSVKTQWSNQKFIPIAWDGQDAAHPEERTTDADGNAEFPAPPTRLLHICAGSDKICATPWPSSATLASN